MNPFSVELYNSINDIPSGTDMNYCTPFCKNNNEPRFSKDLFNVTQQSGYLFELIKSGFLVSVTSDFSIYEDMLYYKDGIYSYYVGEQIFKSFFIATGYRADGVRQVIYGLTFVPGRGMIKIQLFWDEFPKKINYKTTFNTLRRK